MSALTQAPLNYDFGEDFAYNSWDENTVLTLINVPWNTDYRDIVRFSSKTARDTWIDNQSGINLTNVSLQKFAQDVVIDTPLNAALKFNYLRAANALMNGIAGDVQRNYYYFVTGVTYLSPNATRLSLQLDVWQTFGYEVSFGNVFVERGHIGIANTNAFDNYGRDYLDTPEGFDVGGEYRIIKTARDEVMGAASAVSDANYSVLVCSVTDLTKNPGFVDAPALSSATGSVVDGIVSGASFYVFPTATDFQKYLKAFTNFPWVTQGIISATIIPKVTRYFPGASFTDVAPSTSAPLPDGVSGPPTTIPPDYVMYKYPGTLSGTRDTALAANWRDNLLSLIPLRYRGLKKFLTFPYCMIEVTTWTGQPLVVRPEAWNDPDATIREQAVMMPPSQRIAFIPYRYNGDSATTPTSTDDRAEYLDFATTIDRFPSVPVVNNMAINFLAANNAGLGFSFASADWSQQRALRGNETHYRQATAGLDLQYQQDYLSRSARLEQMSNAAGQTAGHAIVGGAGAIGIGAMNDGPAGAGVGALGAAAGLANAAISMQGMSNAAQIANRQSLASTTASVHTGEYVRDTNKDFADFAARGDYQNSIAGVNAKIQDARLTQPSTAGQFGGDAMNLAHDHSEVAVRWKMIDNSQIRKIGNFWLRYGYSVNQFVNFASGIPSDLLVMEKFTYWKLSETYIGQGNFPEAFKQTIRGIFEKGVTVWRTPADIGMIDWADNKPLTGISY